MITKNLKSEDFDKEAQTQAEKAQHWQPSFTALIVLARVASEMLQFEV